MSNAHVSPSCTPGHEQRCVNASSATCDCRCGGWNHGNPAARPGPDLDPESHTQRVVQIEEELEGPYKRELKDDRPPEDAKILYLRRRSNAAGHKGGANIVLHRNGIDNPVPHRYDYHSPTGMEFGYGGSGPADAALNILALFVPGPTAFRLHQDFKWRFVAPAKEGDELEVARIVEWIKENW